jgi:hypothetical protein
LPFFVGNLFWDMRLIRWSLFPLPLILLGFLPVHAGSKPPPRITLRVYIQTAGEGLPTTQAISMPLPPNGEIIQVRAFPEISEHDLIDVKTDPNGNVYFILNHRGKTNLDATTGEDQGRIMVVMLNGYVIYAPIIDQQITNGVLEIPHALPAEVVTALRQIAQDNVKNAPPAPRPVY